MHPIRFDLDYKVERSRLTTFFRLLVAIPWIVWAYIYGIAAFVAAFIAWFAMLFTKEYPKALYDFVAGYVEVTAQIGGFILLATDEWPPFLSNGESAYPVRVDVAPRQVEYRRSRTFFKLLLAFPQQLLLYGLGFVIYGAWIVSWWRIMITGKQSVTMHDALRAAMAYSLRANGFVLLLTEVHPRLLDLPAQEFPEDAPALPGPGQLPQMPAPTAALPADAA